MIKSPYFLYVSACSHSASSPLCASNFLVIRLSPCVRRESTSDARCLMRLSLSREAKKSSSSCPALSYARCGMSAPYCVKGTKAYSTGFVPSVTMVGAYTPLRTAPMIASNAPQSSAPVQYFTGVSVWRVARYAISLATAAEIPIYLSKIQRSVRCSGSAPAYACAKPSAVSAVGSSLSCAGGSSYVMPGSTCLLLEVVKSMVLSTAMILRSPSVKIRLLYLPMTSAIR